MLLQEDALFINICKYEMWKITNELTMCINHVFKPHVDKELSPLKFHSHQIGYYFLFNDNPIKTEVVPKTKQKSINNNNFFSWKSFEKF